MVVDFTGRHAQRRQLLLPVAGVSFLRRGQLEKDVAVLAGGLFGQAPVEEDVVEFLLDVAAIPPGVGNGTRH
jgi:hypothetical protein